MNTNRQVSWVAGIIGILALTYGLAPFWGMAWGLLMVEGLTVGTVLLGVFVALLNFTALHGIFTLLGLLFFATGIRMARES